MSNRADTSVAAEEALDASKFLKANRHGEWSEWSDGRRAAVGIELRPHLSLSLTYSHTLSLTHSRFVRSFQAGGSWGVSVGGELGSTDADRYAAAIRRQQMK